MKYRGYVGEEIDFAGWDDLTAFQGTWQDLLDLLVSRGVLAIVEEVE